MGRITFLDNLRSAIILLVIIFHAAMAYMVYVPDWWYVIDENKIFSADILVIWADVFIMPVLFFLSGYFGIRSLSQDGAVRFLQKKCWRIGVPWILGAMIVAPWIAYLMVASRGWPLSFSDFYWQYFWGVAYQHAHYWFLGVLLSLYMLLLFICTIAPDYQQRISYPRYPSGGLFGMVILLGALGYGLVLYFVPDGVWIHPLYLLVLQPTRLPLYLLYFGLGVYAWRSGWFTSFGYQISSAWWTLAFIGCSIFYLLFVLVLPTVYILPSLISLIIKAILWSVLCFTALFGLLALFFAFFDQTNAFWCRISPVSYSMYWAHQLIVLLGNWLVRDWPIHSMGKLLLVCCLSLSVIYLISRYLLHPLPFFGGKISQHRQRSNRYTI